MGRISIAACAALVVGLGLVPVRVVGQSPPDSLPPARLQAHELCSTGLDLLYNLDHGDALDAFEQAIAVDPKDPAPHRFAASAVWMGILFEWGAILVDDYLGQARDVVERPRPSPAADRAFHDHIARALDLSEQALRERETDPEMFYQLGASEGFLASYIATVEGRLIGSIGHARRAFGFHERVLQLNASRKDAGLVPGMYRYSLSAMSLPVRLLARLAGIPSGRAQGLRQVEEAAAYPGDAQADAMFILIVMYNREDRYEDAVRVIRELQRRYPRNRLLWLEAGTTALRAGDVATARAEIEHGLAMGAADPRPRARGEEARWRLSYGTALLSMDRRAADVQLRAALMIDAPVWVHGRAHGELGKLADLEGRRDEALEEYRLAGRLCRTGNDRVCVDETNRLIRTPYRQPATSQPGSGGAS